MVDAMKEVWPVGRRNALRRIMTRATTPYEERGWDVLFSDIAWGELTWLRDNGYITLERVHDSRRYLPTPLADWAVDQGLLDEESEGGCKPVP